MRHTIPLALVVSTLSALPAVGEVRLPKEDKPLGPRYLRDHAETRGFQLGRPVKAVPTPDGKAVLFLRSQARVPRLRLYEFDVASGKTRELLTPEQVLKGAEEKLSPEEKARRERMRVSVGGFASFQLSRDGRLILLSLSGRLYVVDRARAASRELATGPGPLLDPRFAPDGKSVAYVRDHDVHVFDLEAHKERRVTKGGTATVTHGLAEFVAQEEMDRFAGYWWSPDSSHIAYEEADAKDVEVWYVADPARPGQPPEPQRYPRPGKANVKARLGVISVRGGPTVWVEWDSKRYPYLASVRWPKAGPLLVSVQSRDQRELLLLRADPKTGQTTPLLRETDPAWVALRQDVPHWLRDGRGFLWVSEAEGGPQLELRDEQGKRRAVVVPPTDGFQRLVSVDEAKGVVYYEASPDPTQSRLYRQRIADPGDKALALMQEPGPVIQSATFSKNHAIYVLTTTTPERMPDTGVFELAGALGKLPSVAEHPQFEPRVQFLTVGPKPGFHAAVVLPRDFDPKKRYPVWLDVYGGPHHVHVRASMARWLLDQWYADQGFIVVAADGRGTPGRGRDWERAIKFKFGSVPLDDQVAALKALGERIPQMDLARVGIDGWSFGGYLSALAVCRRPDVFKVGVAGAPVADWLDYDTHYTERYLGVPPADEAAYKEGSLLTYAAGLRRPLLVLHGTADDNVYFRHSLRLVDTLFRAGKEFEMYPLSSLTHMVPDPVVMERLHQRIAGYFRKHLGEPR
jgi:dipeptidyl-peptidase-4